MIRTIAKNLFLKIAPVLATVLAVLMSSAGAASAAALKTPPDRFVRTANYFLKAGTDIRPEHYPLLASYDLLVLPAEAQIHNRTMFKRLRELNPTIIILAYVPSKSYNFGWTDELHLKLRSGIPDNWWLLDPSGSNISVWPGTAVINGAMPWNSYLPQFVRDEIWSTGLWDGVFYDEFSNNISWINGGRIDLHRDGIQDDLTLADTAWRRGMVNILKNTRDLIGADAVIVTNGDSTAELQPYVNGRMFESFPTPWEAGGTWNGVMANYLRLPSLVGYPPVFVINANTGNTGNNADFRKVRYALCSTLLGDGFFSFDFGEADHGQLWRYDEEEVRLGRPSGGPVNLLAPTDRNVVLGVWRRDFENGVVLINSTGESKTVRFGQELEKIRGAQAPDVNDGSIVTAVTIPAADGLILLKPVEKIIGGAFPNGAYARIFDADGARIRNGFFAYVAPFEGMATIVLRDLNDDGVPEKVIAGKGLVSVYADDGTLLTSFRPYGENYAADVSVAIGDLDGDGDADIVTGAGSGSTPLIRTFEADGKSLGPDFYAYDSRFRGGVQVAAGDIDGDGRAEIVTGAGPGGGPHVRIFNRYGRPLKPGFFAADPNSRSGIQVTTTDIDGDRIDEIAALTTDVFQFSLAK